MRGEVHSPCDGKVSARAVVIGGSGGGIETSRGLAVYLADHGIVAIALPYFQFEDLPVSLERIELEYFDHAITLAEKLPDAKTTPLTLIDYSRGSEAALLTAIDNPHVDRVVTIAGSDHVGANIDFADFWGLDAPWVRKGEPMAYATLRENRPGATWAEMRGTIVEPTVAGKLSEYTRTRELLTFAKARIPVESFRGPILLIAAGQDLSWSSVAQSLAILQSRKGLAAATFYLETKDAAQDFVVAPLGKGHEPDADAAAALASIVSFVVTADME